MELIDKAAVVAEIKRIEYETNYKPFTDEVIGERNICRKIRQVLDTLAVKEVDLDKEIIDFINNHYTICFDNNTLQNNEFDFLTIKDVEEIAKHFFELVLKAQKGE